MNATSGTQTLDETVRVLSLRGGARVVALLAWLLPVSWLSDDVQLFVAGVVDAVVFNILSNQLIVAGITGLVLTGSAVSARNLFRYLQIRIRGLFTVRISIMHTSPAFDHVMEWIKHQVEKNRKRVVNYVVYDDSSTVQPDDSVYILQFEGRRLRIEVHMQMGSGSTSPSSQASPYGHIYDKRPYSSAQINVSAFGRDKSVLTRFIERARDEHVSRTTRSFVHTGMKGGWWHIGHDPLPPRTLESVACPNDEAAKTLAVIRAFRSNVDEYIRRGIVRKLTIMLDGIPGMGKTTFVRLIASKLKCNLGVINLSAMTNEGLQGVFRSMPSNTIVVMEDIDCTACTAERGAETGGDVKDDRVTLGTLLNVLDGLGTNSEQIVVLTTNHYERLDPALLRRGRVDHRVTFGAPTHAQLSAYVRRWFGDADMDADAVASKAIARGVPNMAEMQHILVQCKSASNVLKAVDAFRTGA